MAPSQDTHCRTCNTAFPSTHAANFHWETTSCRFKCTLCAFDHDDTSYGSDQGLKDHWKSRHARLYCHECEKVCINSKALRDHRCLKRKVADGHHGDIKFCEGCGDTYLNFSGQDKWHEATCFPEPKGVNECEACGEVFSCVLEMYFHYGEEHVGARYCEGCRRTFRNRHGEERGHGPDCSRPKAKGGEEKEGERERRNGKEDENRRGKGKEREDDKEREHVWAQERFVKDGVEMRYCPNCREFFPPGSHCSCLEGRRPKKPREIQHCFRCRTTYYDDSHCACPQSSQSSNRRHEGPGTTGQDQKSGSRQRVPPSFRKQHYPTNEEKYRSKNEEDTKTDRENDYCWHCKTMYWDDSHRNCPRPGQPGGQRHGDTAQEKSNNKKQHDPSSEEKYRSKHKADSTPHGSQGESSNRKQQYPKSESRYRSWRKENTNNDQNARPKAEGPSQGIPPLYACLKVHPTSSRDAIAEAARRRRIEVHPDRLKRPGMTQSELNGIDERAKNVGHAADVLLDAAKRSKYDREMGGMRRR
ncbi:MAG: hypothetical protein Q9208_007740 [Pyrenodesmia sp. 3 TL-2023]